MIPKALRFEFVSTNLDVNTNELRFEYRVELERGSIETFVERIEVPWATKEQWGRIPTSLIESLHLVLGLTYWKLFCPPEIKHPYHHTTEQAKFWTDLYTHGLGEFFYGNHIDFRGLIQFPSDGASKPPHLVRGEGAGGAVVPFGGGKDSIVTGELLKKAGIDFTLFTLGSSSIQDAGMEIMGKSHLSIKRTIDSRVFELNKEEAVYNGHIPISSIYLFNALLVCLLTEKSWLIFSNEKSANVGNVEYLGMEINHQWSKSLEFELAARSYIETFITPDVKFFSLLRPLFEIAVVERFAKYDRYFPIFSSCNANFKIKDKSLTGRNRWCGRCPKCAFVYALLRAFLPRQQVIDLFGKDLFDDPELLVLYRQLLGLQDFKPFECVGTPDETTLALHLASKREADDRSLIMELFRKEIEPRFTNEQWQAKEKELLAVGDLKTLPDKFRSLL